MRIYNLNSIAESVNSGQITRNDGIRQLAAFVLYNKPLFGLHKYDEDFVSNLIVAMLEKGESFFDFYDEKQGSFFNYFFSYVKNLIHSEKRRLIRESQIEKFTTDQMIVDFTRFTETYQNQNTDYYRVAETPPEYEAEHQENKTHSESTLNNKQANHPFLTLPKLSTRKKAILVISLKHSYYINDSQIRKIAEFCNVDIQSFYDVVQSLKNHMTKRVEKIEKIIEKRNKVFYKTIKLENALKEHTDENQISTLQTQIASEKRKRDRYNNEMSTCSSCTIKATNKEISFYIPLCERQICYYTKVAKELIEKDKDSSKTNEILTSLSEGDFYETLSRNGKQK